MDENLTKLEEEYKEILVERNCALNIAESRIKNIKLTVEHERQKNQGFEERKSPFDTFKSRLKTFDSAYEKLGRRGYEHSRAGFERMKDIAGIRIITPHPRNVYEIRDILISQIEKTKPKNAMRIVEQEDYIKNPKPNGYRSLHIIVEVKVSAVKSKKAKWIPVEIQIRTKLQDVWACYEHEFKYKNPNPSHKFDELFKRTADRFATLDNTLERISSSLDDDDFFLDDIFLEEEIDDGADISLEEEICGGFHGSFFGTGEEEE